MDPATRAALELLYRSLLQGVIVLARVLGKESPVRTREERRAERTSAS